MSRAFVNKDAGGAPEPRYDLPDRASDYYDEAAAWALIQGADAGNTRSAELATGYRWGEPDVVPHVEAILVRAEPEDHLRMAQFARRYLRQAAE